MGKGGISQIAVVLFVTVCALVQPIYAKYSGGSGEPNDPYQIANVADLLLLAEEVNDYNKCFILTADIDLDPCLPGGQVFTTAVIAPDLNNANLDYFEGTPFTGIFDGAGYKVSNLIINTNGNKGDYLGLFGYVIGGEIKNLGLQNISINDGNDSCFIGGLVACNVFGNIINCFSIGTVTGGDYSYYLGMLVGYNEQGNISKCYSKGTITGTGHECIGGLVGSSFGATFNTSINNCFSTVNVTGGDYSEALGGLAGWSGGSINNCYATGAVTGGINSYSWALGGLAGGNQGDINNCFATGAVTSMLDYSRYLGGLVGWSDGGISNCFSTGDVTGGAYSACLGGLVGTNGGVSINDSYSTGSVSGGDYSGCLGGLVGYSGGSISSSYFLITSGPANGYGTPLTDAQMKQQSSFVGWDFVNGPNDVWTIKEDVNYPVLVWPLVNLVSSRFPFGWYEVDFIDLADMANWWGRDDCTTNDDCGGADFDFSGTMDIVDLDAMCSYWLEGS